MPADDTHHDHLDPGAPAVDETEPERPHLLQRTPGGPLEPASTDEVAGLVSRHSWHDGIAYFPGCPECTRKMNAGEYPHWQNPTGA